MMAAILNTVMGTATNPYGQVCPGSKVVDDTTVAHAWAAIKAEAHGFDHKAMGSITMVHADAKHELPGAMAKAINRAKKAMMAYAVCLGICSEPIQCESLADAMHMAKKAHAAVGSAIVFIGHGAVNEGWTITATIPQHITPLQQQCVRRMLADGCVAVITYSDGRMPFIACLSNPLYAHELGSWIDSLSTCTLVVPKHPLTTII